MDVEKAVGHKWQKWRAWTSGKVSVSALSRASVCVFALLAPAWVTADEAAPITPDPASWRYLPSLDAEGLLSTAGGARLEPGQLDLGLSLSRTLGMAPVRLPSSPAWDGTTLQRTRFEFSAAWMPISHLQVQLSLPLITDSLPDVLLPLEGTLNDQVQTGLGDVRLGAFVPLNREGKRYPVQGGPSAFGAFGVVTIPTGDGARFAAQGTPGFELGVSGETGHTVHVVSNGSFELSRPFSSDATPEPLHGRLHGRLGLLKTVVPFTWEVMLEAHGTIEALPEPGAVPQRAFELTAGVRHRRMSGWSYGLGLGVDFTTEAAPLMLAQLTVHRELPPNRIDRDDDNVLDAQDACLTEPEDKDGFNDQDGCPELDNDNDGLVDTIDRCPLDPEDLDGYRDLDGCPEPDNDLDGVLDPQDKCPLEAEDKDNFRDDDGCPELDNDKDGLLDSRDKCPNEPEDKDNFEDSDGCIDPDNDNDGILDTGDRCQFVPEDKDGFEDQDGCPEPDNDKDGLNDDIDLCPVEAEDSPGQLRDGCPSSKKLVQRGDRWGVLEEIYFDPTDRQVLVRSAPVLTLLAEALLKEPTTVRFQLEVYIQSRGNPEQNLSRTNLRAKAIEAELLKAGVPQERLTCVGYGEQPAEGVPGMLLPSVQVRMVGKR